MKPPCGKIGYGTRKAAKEALRRTRLKRRDGKRGRHEQRVYKCPDCELWHLTSGSLYPASKQPKIFKEKKRRRPCLRCGRKIWSTAAKRICTKCAADAENLGRTAKRRHRSSIREDEIF